MAQLRDLDIPPDSYMMIVAYRGSDEVGRWGGPIDFPVIEPSLFKARRDGNERDWSWKDAPPGPLRVNGSRDPSWIDNPDADLASSGGRTPTDHGKAGGSASGEQDGKGHIDGAGWLNLLDVPERVAPAVAAAIILTEADVMGFGQSLFSRTVRGLSRKAMGREIESEAKAAARKLGQRARARMESAKPRPPPASHVDDVMAHMPHELELGYYHELARRARERVELYRSALARTRGQTDEAARYAHRVAEENRRAWLEIESVCQERIQVAESAVVRSASKPSGPTKATATGRPPDAVAKQPYDPHKMRATQEAKHPGKVTSTTVPKSNHPNVKHRGETPPGSSLVYDVRGFPIFDDVAVYDLRLSESIWKKRSRTHHQRAATRQLRNAIADGRVPRGRFTAKQLEDIDKGRAKIRGYTWHHHQDVGRMQLVPEEYHDASAHVGGFALWGRGR